MLMGAVKTLCISAAEVAPFSKVWLLVHYNNQPPDLIAFCTTFPSLLISLSLHAIKILHFKIKSRRQKTEEMFCIKEETCVRNKDSKWANILKTYMPPPFSFCTLAGVELLSCLSSLGGGLLTPPLSQERGQPGLEQSGKFFHLGCCFVWMWASSGAFWSWTHCWCEQVKFLWQSQRCPWWFLKGVNCSRCHWEGRGGPG